MKIVLMVVLLRRVAAFIINAVLPLRKFPAGDSSTLLIPSPEVPPFVRDLIQRE